jgi:hypothetical protein
MNVLHYGVVVGINRYPDLRPLKRAKGDAEAFYEWLTDPQGGGVPSENVALIVVDDNKMPDGTLREAALPTRAEVFNALFKFRKAIDEHIAEYPENWEQSRLYFYVSGHGIAPVPKEAALLTANAGPEWYGENVACSRLLSFFGECQFFKELVIFADCCREWVSDAPLGDVPWTRTKRNNGAVRTVFGCATCFGDIALEPDDAVGDETDPDKLRGYFTQALLEGLRGQEPVDPNGEINSNSLAIYVKQRVIDLTKNRRHPQEPTMDADPAAPIVFRTGVPAATANPTQVKHRVRLRFVTPFQGKARVLNGDLTLIDEHQVPDGAWVVELANGLYVVTPTDSLGGVDFRNEGFFRVWGEDCDVEL